MSEAPMQVTAVGRTDLGRTRDHNEDTFLVADLSAAEGAPGSQLVSHPVGERGLLFLVADGMGGAAAGELASAMAADLISGHLSSVWACDPEPSVERFTYRLREAVELANQHLHAYAKTHPEVRGMGTTATVAGLFGHALYLAQVGDSRAYLIRGEKAVQLTKDQSLMQRLVDAGELTEEEAAASERRNIILQALGPDPVIKVELTHQTLRAGDVLVLCSDGLSNQVKKDEIAAAAARHAGLEGLVDELVELANGRGGPDNITVLAVRFDGEDSADPSEESEPAYRPFHTGTTEDELEAVPEPPPPPPPPPQTWSGSPLVFGLGLFGLLALLAWLLKVVL